MINACYFGVYMFYFEKINSKKILKSDLINKAEIFFTTKESFIKTKDKNLIQQVLKNKEDISNFLNTKHLVSPKQIHGDNIAVAEKLKEYSDTDSLIVTSKNFAIFLNYADCTPVVLYDEKQNIGALIHAGWRGTAKSIVTKTLDKMGSNPKDIKAIIGPCICYKCFETNYDVILELKKTIKNTDGLFSDRYADLKGINERQLREKGVEQIDICPYCTCCNNDLFFSYRKENKTTSRISAILKLN